MIKRRFLNLISVKYRFIYKLVILATLRNKIQIDPIFFLFHWLSKWQWIGHINRRIDNRWALKVPKNLHLEKPTTDFKRSHEVGGWRRLKTDCRGNLWLYPAMDFYKMMWFSIYSNISSFKHEINWNIYLRSIFHKQGSFFPVGPNYHD